MAIRNDPEFLQWMEENNFSEADLVLIRKKAAGREFLWFLLLPFTLGCTFPLMLNASVMRKIVKQRTFDIRVGFIAALYFGLLHLTYLYIAPLIVRLIVKKKPEAGTGINSLIKKGKICNGSRVD